MSGKTRGQLEAEISAAITSFEKEHLGRGPKETRSYIIEDMILIRLCSILTPAEQKLAANAEGAQLIKQMRRKLIESSRPILEALINDITGCEITSMHSDISSQTGERIFVFCLNRNLEAEFMK